MELEVGDSVRARGLARVRVSNRVRVGVRLRVPVRVRVLVTVLVTVWMSVSYDRLGLYSPGWEMVLEVKKKGGGWFRVFYCWF